MTNICDKYSKTALMGTNIKPYIFNSSISLLGNWYEERWAPDQPIRQPDNVKEVSYVSKKN